MVAPPPRLTPAESATATDPVPELHITSLVVHAAPSRLPAVSAFITKLAGAEIHGTSANGKLVVTIEAASTDETMNRISAIQRLDGVLSAALVYQHSETLDSMNEQIEDANGPQGVR